MIGALLSLGSGLVKDKVEAVVVAVGVLAACALIAYGVHHERQVGAERVEAVRKLEHAQAAFAAASQVMADRLERARQDAAQKEISHEADRFNAAAAVAARDAAAADQRLRERLVAAGRSAGAAAAAASVADPGAPADPASAVPWRVFVGVDDAAGQLATYADQLRGALDACVGSYQALTPESDN